MRNASWELELPLDDGSAGEMARRRLDHLRALPGSEPQIVVRLARSYRSLAALYAASEAELAAHIGRVAAARVRWFLDAPLDTRLAAEPAAIRTQHFPHAA